MLSVKQLLTKILGWIFKPVLNNDGTYDDGNTFYRAIRTDTNVNVAFGVGSGGTNHGVYSSTLNKWLIYGDERNVYVNGYKFELGTNNTSDTWIPVLKGSILQHRVIPSNASATVTKQGSYYSSGAINVIRRGNCVTIDMYALDFSSISSRVTIAIIPAGFRPPVTVYGIFTDTSSYFLVNPDGTIQVNAMSASKKWGTVTYCVG